MLTPLRPRVRSVPSGTVAALAPVQVHYVSFLFYQYAPPPRIIRSTVLLSLDDILESLLPPALCIPRSSLYPVPYRHTVSHRSGAARRYGFSSKSTSSAANPDCQVASAPHVSPCLLRSPSPSSFPLRFLSPRPAPSSAPQDCGCLDLWSNNDCNCVLRIQPRLPACLY